MSSVAILNSVHSFAARGVAKRFRHAAIYVRREPGEVVIDLRMRD